MDAPSSEVTIAGRHVKLHERFPAKDNWDLLQRIMETGRQAQEGGLDLEAEVPVLARIIESWEFDGDPTDPEAYGELDLFRELLPLVEAVTKYIAEMTPGERG